MKHTVTLVLDMPGHEGYNRVLPGDFVREMPNGDVLVAVNHVPQNARESDLALVTISSESIRETRWQI